MEIGLLFNAVSITFAFLLIASLAALFSERTGVINIAVNGNMIIGGVLFALFGFYTNANNTFGNDTQFIAILIAMIGGGLFSALHAFACITLKSNQIIVGTALNILAGGIGLFLVTQPQSMDAQYPTNYTLFAFDSRFRIANVYVIAAIAIAIIIFIFFKFTKTGVHFVAAGENPNALDSMGINVIRIRYTAVIISGMLSGLAGAIYCFSVSNAFAGQVRGEGFVALALMIFGQWRVPFIVLGALLFSFLTGLGQWLPQTNNVFFRSNSNLLLIAPFVITIVVMVGFWKYSNMPKADGEPFIPGKRE